jgi:hypothetical protein
MKCRSCIRIKFREGHSRCGLCLCFTKAGGCWKVRRLPRTLPPTLRIANITRPRCHLLLSIRESRLCLFLSRKRRNYSPAAKDKRPQQDGQGRRSVIINTRDACPLSAIQSTDQHVQPQPLWRLPPLVRADSVDCPMSQTRPSHQPLPNAMPTMTTTRSCSSPTTRSRQSLPRWTPWTTSISKNDVACLPSTVCPPNCSSPRLVVSHQPETSCHACSCPRIGREIASPCCGTVRKQTTGPASTASSSRYAKQNACSPTRIWSNV